MDEEDQGESVAAGVLEWTLYEVVREAVGRSQPCRVL